MRKIPWIILGFIFITVIGGCIEYEAYERIPEPPPAQVEVVGVAPFLDAIWIPGYWVWHKRHHQYRWRAGYWRRR